MRLKLSLNWTWILTAFGCFLNNTDFRYFVRKVLGNYLEHQLKYV